MAEAVKLTKSPVNPNIWSPTASVMFRILHKYRKGQFVYMESIKSACKTLKYNRLNLLHSYTMYFTINHVN